MSDTNVSKGARIGGWILGIVPVLLFLMSATFKFLQPGPEFKQGLEEMGWTSEGMFILGFVEVGCAIIYLIPRTSVIGAILLTAYMGGAVATHARLGQAFVVQVLIGMAIWGGLWLRDTRIRSLIPFTRP